MLENNFCIRLPGHILVLQVVVDDVDPTQVLPPFDGAGLLQVLVWVLNPVPQVFVHEL